MRIAILGIRGIPANYGGFETFAEELAPRLVCMGHEVTVYCRTNNIDYDGDTYKSVHLVKLPTISHKYLDTLVHTFLSGIHSIGSRYDAVLMCNAANALFAILPRLGGAGVALNVDGIERLRKKWGKAGKIWYSIGERLATRLPDALVADAEVIRCYYETRYGVEPTMIPYGATPHPSVGDETLRRYGLEPQEYVLYVSRLEPENNADVAIDAFRRVDTQKRLVVVGDAPYAKAYKRQLAKLAEADDRVVMTGFVYGDGYRQLQANAYCYVQATEVGGTHPALVEAMAYGNAVIANGTDENQEVLNGAGLFYAKNDAEDLARQMQRLIDDPQLVDSLGSAAAIRAQERYSWEAVAMQYEQLLESVCAKRRRSRGRHAGAGANEQSLCLVVPEQKGESASTTSVVGAEAQEQEATR